MRRSFLCSTCSSCISTSAHKSPTTHAFGIFNTVRCKLRNFTASTNGNLSSSQYSARNFLISKDQLYYYSHNAPSTSLALRYSLYYSCHLPLTSSRLFRKRSNHISHLQHFLKCPAFAICQVSYVTSRNCASHKLSGTIEKHALCMKCSAL